MTANDGLTAGKRQVVAGITGPRSLTEDSDPNPEQGWRLSVARFETLEVLRSKTHVLIDILQRLEFVLSQDSTALLEAALLRTRFLQLN